MLFKVRIFNNFGMSLLEIVIALLILCVGLISSLTLFHSGLKANIRTTTLNRMHFFAQEEMEGIKRAGYEAEQNGEIEFRYASSPYEDIQYKIAVDKPELLGEPPDLQIKRVTLTVKAFDGRQLVEREFVNYISK